MIVRRLALPMLAMPRFAKRVVVLALDTGLCVLTVWLAYYLRLSSQGCTGLSSDFPAGPP
jgi:hypothetical protein